MKVILTQDMANELLTNEELIKKQEGPYRPRFNPHTKMFEPVIKCFPLEPFTGEFPQERLVTPGMENEVSDIALATIDEGKISYKETPYSWRPGYNAFTRSMEPDIYMRKYSILIYRPDFAEKTIFLTADQLGGLYAQLKEHRVVGIKEDNEVLGKKVFKEHFEHIDEWFQKFQGICTYILFEGDSIWKAGKFDNKKYW